MNIIFCRYRNVCEPDYIDAFKAFDINVIEVFVNELGVTDVSQKAGILLDIVLKSSPMFVFTINYFPYISMVCEETGIKYVSVSVTCPVVEIYNRTIKNTCNRVFLFDRQQYLSVKDENPNGIFYLPLGAAEQRISDLLGEEKSFRYDVSFIGSLYNEKDPFLELKLSEEKKKYFEDIIDRQLKLSADGQNYLEEAISDEDVELIKSLGKDFYPSDMSVRSIDHFVAVNNYLSPHMTYIERVRILNEISAGSDYEVHLFTQSKTDKLRNVICHGGVETLNEMPLVFRQTKINLNISTRSIKTGIPQRVWDVLASGGFLLTNYQEELPENFENGKHLVMYENMDELKELIHYYLEHDDERCEIAGCGHELVAREGTVLNRVISIIREIAG